MTPIKETFKLGQHTVTLETGQIARQADGAVLVSIEDTVVLVTATGKKVPEPGRDFMPLTVNYQEKTYAAGKIPGGFFKREGRPTEKETLTSRLIDRPLRPLFPKGYTQDVQVIATVVSLNPEINPDMPALIGASAAMALSGIPFDGPVGGLRVGYIDNEYVVNPTTTQMVNSKLDLIVAGTADAVLMVESEALILPEDVMLGAVVHGHEQMQTTIKAIQSLADKAGKPAWDWEAPQTNKDLTEAVSTIVLSDVEAALDTQDKLDRKKKIDAAKAKAIEALVTEESGYSSADVATEVYKIEKHILRSRVLDGQQRIDGRDSKTVRALDIHVGVLPRTHGSALFTRGETQAIVATTLGTDRDAQIIDALEGERKDGFMLHYNFPPYCVGEVGFMSGPKRREIGHGNLARRAIQAVLPTHEAFPYTLRVVSEITESNGSSSMASVCGTSLSLMDAGVPLKAPVSGIAMGLVKEGDKHVVLTDILGDEDHLGDMDFKVAGTREGLTALQMDIKIKGITKEIMQEALQQAQAGRLHILEAMDKIISQSREEISEWAPSIVTIKIDPEKIRDVIGKGGATIRGITADTGATIDIDDDGTVRIASVDGASGREAQKIIEQITAELEVGQIYEGEVARLMDFGAIVNILPGKDGLVHISQISEERVEKVSDKLSEGDKVRVKVLEIDRQGRVRLSMKEVSDDEAAA